MIYQTKNILIFIEKEIFCDSASVLSITVGISRLIIDDLCLSLNYSWR